MIVIITDPENSQMTQILIDCRKLGPTKQYRKAIGQLRVFHVSAKSTVTIIGKVGSRLAQVVLPFTRSLVQSTGLHSIHCQLAKPATNYPPTKGVTTDMLSGRWILYWPPASIVESKSYMVGEYPQEMCVGIQNRATTAIFPRMLGDFYRNTIRLIH